MGHATHFLERLQRLSENQHIDLALALYRDSNLVRYILERARLPEGADRVALALEDRPDGPHIIVARDGGFVTCLGENMGVGDRPVISRAQISRLSDQIDGMRAAVAQVRESKEAARLIGLVSSSGSDLSREDFTTLVTLAPMMAHGCVPIAIELAMELKTFERGYRRSRYRRLVPRTREELQRYWAYSWALGHLIAIYGSRGHELAEMAGPGVRDKHDEIVFVLAQTAVRTMLLPVLLRGVWIAAHGGRKRLSMFKQELQQSRTFLGTLMGGLPLMGIGLRHRTARAEVHKLLGRSKRKLEEEAEEGWEGAISRAILAGGERIFAQEPEVRGWQQTLGAAMAVHAGRHLPPAHPWRFEQLEEVPEELAGALPCNQDAVNLFTSAEHQTMMLSMLPWAVSASIEQLYLPAGAIEAYGADWQPDPVRQHLDNHNWYFVRNVPARAAAKPGRNDPCPCNSGKKYKRCCGAA